MRKIKSEYENPFDNAIYYFIQKVAPTVWMMGLTPNMITTFSIISVIISTYFIYHRRPILAVFFYLLNYFFDCLDGYLARKYKIITVFGDYYDHVSDIIGMVLTFYILFKVNSKFMKKIIPVFIILLIFLNFHIYFQEKIYNNVHESTTLQITNYIIPSFIKKDDPKKYIKITKYFGCGTYILFTCAVIYYVTKCK